VLREAAAVALVQPRRGRRPDDEGDELDGVQTRELRDVGELPEIVPRRHCDLGFAPESSNHSIGFRSRLAGGTNGKEALGPVRVQGLRDQRALPGTVLLPLGHGHARELLREPELLASKIPGEQSAAEQICETRTPAFPSLA